MNTSARTIFALRTVRQLTRQWQLVGGSVEHTRADHLHQGQSNGPSALPGYPHPTIGFTCANQLLKPIKAFFYRTALAIPIAEDLRGVKLSFRGLFSKALSVQVCWEGPEPAVQVPGCLVAQPSGKCFLGVPLSVHLLRRRHQLLQLLLFFAFLANCHSRTDYLRVKWPSPR